MNSEFRRNRTAEEKQGARGGGELSALIARTCEISVGLNREIMRFAAIQLQHDVEFGASLMTCKDPGEVLNAQQKWLSTAFIDYAKEWPKLFQLAMLSEAQQLGPPRNG